MRPARTAAEIAAVQDLCRAYVAALQAEYPGHRAALAAYFAPGRWSKVLEDLPAIHARPCGDMLLLYLADLPAGCIMWKPSVPGIAEVKRLFVQPAARRRGGGTALVEAAARGARADGYRELHLEAAVFLTPAQAVFRACGFSEMRGAVGHAIETREKNLLFRRRV